MTGADHTRVGPRVCHGEVADLQERPSEGGGIRNSSLLSDGDERRVGDGGAIVPCPGYLVRRYPVGDTGEESCVSSRYSCVSGESHHSSTNVGYDKKIAFKLSELLDS